MLGRHLIHCWLHSLFPTDPFLETLYRAELVCSSSLAPPSMPAHGSAARAAYLGHWLGTVWRCAPSLQRKMKKLRQIMLPGTLIPAKKSSFSKHLCWPVLSQVPNWRGEYCKSADSRWLGVFETLHGVLRKKCILLQKWWLRDLHIEYYILVWYRSIEIGCQCKHLTETRAVFGKIIYF